MKTAEEKKKWEHLYNKYKNNVQPSEKAGPWKSFQGFSRWAMENGYQDGGSMRRRDSTKPHSPENSYFIAPSGCKKEYSQEELRFIRKWNQTVNRLRQAVGLEPFPLPDISEEEP